MGYRFRFTSQPLLRKTPWKIRSPQGPKKMQGMQEQISPMLQKNTITEVSPNSLGIYSNIFLVRKASGGWRPVIELKQMNAHIFAPRFPMFNISSVQSIVRKGDYAFKIDLQDVYFHVPIHPSSRKYLRFAFENKVYQVCVLPWGLNKASSFTLPSVTAVKHARLGRLDFERKEVRAGSSTGYPVSRYAVTSGSGESLTPRIQGQGDNSTCLQDILPISTVISMSVPIHGFTQLGLRSLSFGSFTFWV